MEIELFSRINNSIKNKIIKILPNPLKSCKALDAEEKNATLIGAGLQHMMGPLLRASYIRAIEQLKIDLQSGKITQKGFDELSGIAYESYIIELKALGERVIAQRNLLKMSQKQKIDEFVRNFSSPTKDV